MERIRHLWTKTHFILNQVTKRGADESRVKVLLLFTTYKRSLKYLDHRHLKQNHDSQLKWPISISSSYILLFHQRGITSTPYDSLWNHLTMTDKINVWFAYILIPTPCKSVVSKAECQLHTIPMTKQTEWSFSLSIQACSRWDEEAPYNESWMKRFLPS